METEGRLTDEDCRAVAEGIALKDFTTRPGRLEILESSEKSRALVYICEGKFHQVRRMLGAREKPVTYLKRLAVGGLKLDSNLEPGQWREMTREEAELVFTEQESFGG